MGTNYYIEVETEKGTYPVRLGKKSHGWHFLFDASGVITGLKSAQRLTERFAIVDEHGEHHSAEEFWRQLRYSSQSPLLSNFGDKVFEEEGYYFSQADLT